MRNTGVKSPSRILIFATIACVACADGTGSGAIVSITLDRTEASVGVGAAIPLTAFALDANGDVIGNPGPYSWVSSNTAVATVDANGVVRGIALGAVEIAASNGGRSASANVIVTPESVVISPSFATLAVGESVQLSAIAYDAQGVELDAGPISWAIREVTIAGAVELTAAGRLTAIAPGIVRIDATMAGRTATYTVGIPSPFDGAWSGNDASGSEVQLTVEFGSVMTFALPRIVIPECTIRQFTATLNVPIVDDHFTAALLSPSGQVTGSFETPQLVTGTYGAIFLGVFACDGRIITNPHSLPASAFTLTR